MFGYFCVFSVSWPNDVLAEKYIACSFEQIHCVISLIFVWWKSAVFLTETVSLPSTNFLIHHILLRKCTDSELLLYLYTHGHRCPWYMQIKNDPSRQIAPLHHRTVNQRKTQVANWHIPFLCKIAEECFQLHIIFNLGKVDRLRLVRLFALALVSNMNPTWEFIFVLI